MTAGNQTTQASVNQAVGAMVIALRNDFATILSFSQWLNTVGATGLETLGFTTADATTIVSTVGNLATLVSIWQGGAPGSAFNYMANTEALWGGQ
jgi:hypothetical protein